MKSKSVEFIDLFDPDVIGNGPAAAGYQKAGVPYRFAALSYGAKRADVGYAVAGVDVSNLWAAKGTASYIPTNIFARSLSAVGGIKTATVRFQIKTNGELRVVASGTNTGGGGTYNYAPTAVGASAPYDFRISGSISGIRNPTSTCQLAGKGGVSFTGGGPPSGASGTYDTGWIASADDAADFLTFTTTAPNNSGESSLGGSIKIELRRKSDGVVVFSSAVSGVDCIADSQS